MKYARSLVHAFYAVVAIAVMVVATPAGASFVANHPAVAALIPLLVAVARAIETFFKKS